jgi:hypothetical protein
MRFGGEEFLAAVTGAGESTMLAVRVSAAQVLRRP